MGKNDLWIVVMVFVINFRLIFLDKDFNYLKGEYLDLFLIEI